MTTIVAIHLVTQLAAAAAVLSSCESLVRLRWFAEGSMMDWEVARLSQSWLTHGPVARGLAPVFVVGGLRWLFVARIAVALALVLVPWGRGAGVMTGFLFVTTCALAVRCSWGHDGADQMMVALFGALALAGLVATATSARWALWFIAGQAILAYFVAGASKLAAPSWRDGTALAQVFNTRMYGHRGIASLLARYPRIAQLASWSVIAFECAYPLVLVAPRPVVYALLAASFSFHLVAATVMGLNTFLWAFVATYPALLVIAR